MLVRFPLSETELTIRPASCSLRLAGEVEGSPTGGHDLLHFPRHLAASVLALLDSGAELVLQGLASSGGGSAAEPPTAGRPSPGDASCSSCKFGEQLPHVDDRLMPCRKSGTNGGGRARARASDPTFAPIDEDDCGNVVPHGPRAAGKAVESMLCAKRGRHERSECQFTVLLRECANDDCCHQALPGRELCALHETLNAGGATGSDVRAEQAKSENKCERAEPVGEALRSSAADHIPTGGGTSEGIDEVPAASNGDEQWTYFANGNVEVFHLVKAGRASCDEVLPTTGRREVCAQPPLSDERLCLGCLDIALEAAVGSGTAPDGATADGSGDATSAPVPTADKRPCSRCKKLTRRPVATSGPTAGLVLCALHRSGAAQCIGINKAARTRCTSDATSADGKHCGRHDPERAARPANTAPASTTSEAANG